MNVVKWLRERPWFLTIIHLELDVGRYPETRQMDRLSHLRMPNAPRRLRGAQIGSDDFGHRILVTYLDRLLLGHSAIDQVGNEFQKE